MVFSSITFILYFLPVVLLVYHLIPGVKAKNLVLLLASLVFYAWGEPVYILLMLLSIAGNYYLVRFMTRAREAGANVRPHLWFAVLWNLSLLFFFKYANMAIGLVNRLAGTSLAELRLALPIGISFYTFQALSYVIDVYRGNAACQENILDFGLYISMFPQLIAGPIVKYTDIEKALSERKVTPADFGRGTELFILGLAKKVLLANNAGEIFSAVTALQNQSFVGAWLGALAYAFQIYFDFSGYSDMAIGLGYMLGFRFPENFRYPYMASSVTDFWRRWHISLSSWFRDYVYIPLGGNRVSVPKHVRNILIVWLLTGLWHGASWNFVLWGLYYGLWLLIEKYLLADFSERRRALSHVLTGFVVLFGWVIFAFTDLRELGSYLLRMFGIGAAGFLGAETMGLLRSSLLLLLVSALAATDVPYAFFQYLRKKVPPLAIALLLLLAVLSAAFLVYQSYNPFLYFRF